MSCDAREPLVGNESVSNFPRRALVSRSSTMSLSDFPQRAMASLSMARASDYGEYARAKEARGRADRSPFAVGEIKGRSTIYSMDVKPEATVYRYDVKVMQPHEESDEMRGRREQQERDKIAQGEKIDEDAAFRVLTKQSDPTHSGVEIRCCRDVIDALHTKTDGFGVDAKFLYNGTDMLYTSTPIQLQQVRNGLVALMTWPAT